MEQKSEKDWGALGEEAAAEHLKGKGYKILERNFRYGREGELDIVAEKGGTLVFVEVKMRRSDRFASPEDSVTFGKRKQIARMARAYISSKNRMDTCCRFDVVSVGWEKGQPVVKEHHEDAFRPPPMR
jgi:putative endonuclease